MNMQPVVNGLEQTYADQIEFRELNANAPDGQQAFRAYALPGHPGYVLLNPQGEILWKGFGEQSRDSIEAQLQLALEK
ncbi:MAG: hypothetical protein QY302_02940 [Anaerolineales bacterium]|nr:MAG: hypothetical protein QY302_02940 [Anaerolineales bacterium]